MIRDKRIFIIDSSQRIPDPSSSDSNFNFQINLPQNEQFTNVVLLYALIPKSYYLVDNYNTFQLKEGATTVTISIPKANYNINTFITQIIPLINSNSPNGWVYACSYPKATGSTDYDTGKYTFTVTGNTSQPSFIFDSTTTVYEQFGFSSSSTNQFSGNSLTSTNVVKFQNEDTLFIHSANLVDNSINSPQSDILQEIYCSATPPYTQIIYQCTAPEFYSKKILNQNANCFNFVITNEHQQVLNLNGLNCLFTLCFWK